MPNPTTMTITDRGCFVALSAAQVAALPTVRYADANARALYGQPTAGTYLVELRAGDVIADASTIAALLAVTTDSASYPSASPVFWR